MFVERVYREDGDRTAVKITGIVTKAGDGELFRHGTSLFANTQEHLPQGFFAHAQRELGALVLRVPTEEFELKELDILGAAHTALCNTYGPQVLRRDNGKGQTMLWTPEGAVQEVETDATQSAYELV